jgi:hypothetical protein
MRVRPAELESMRFGDFLDSCCHLFRALLHARSSRSLRRHGCQTWSLVLRDRVDVKLEDNHEVCEEIQNVMNQDAKMGLESGVFFKLGPADGTIER